MDKKQRQTDRRTFDPVYSTAKIIVIYVIFGVLWIFFTDMIVEAIADDVHELNQLQNYKGWLYVLITAGVFYWLIYVQMRRYQSALQMSLRTVGELKEMRKELLISEERYQLALNGSKDGIWDWNFKNNTFFFSDNWMDAFGYDQKDIPNDLNELLTLIHVDDRQTAYEDFHAYIVKETDEYESVFRLKKKNGGYRHVLARGEAVWNEWGEAVRMAGSHTDITEQIRLQEKLRQIAYVDELTGFPNRLGFEQHFNAYAETYDAMAFVFLDIDDFKDINEMFGHEAGDELLKTFADDLRKRRDDDVIIGRLGGDGFGLLIPLIRDHDDFASMFSMEFERMKKNHVFESQKVYVSVSAGFAIYPEDGKDFSSLFQATDLALHHAKSQGKGRMMRYDDTLYEATKEHLEMSNAMRQGLKQDQFSIVYQPIFNLKEDRLVGLEALLRWHHPDKGLIPPNEFIPLAEETGFIIDIDDFVIDRVCRQKKTWLEAGLTDIRINVNVSQVSFDRGNIVRMFREHLKTHGLDGSHLVIEITETAAMEHREKAIKTLSELRKMGLKVAIDDFGTGYASLTNLWDLPIDILKIDRYFTDKIITEKKMDFVVRVLIDSAHALGCEVTAEGIETEEQKTWMKEHGVDKGQGYHLFRPQSTDVINETYIRS